MTFKFQELFHALDFVKPLLINGYDVQIYPIFDVSDGHKVLRSFNVQVMEEKDE